MNFDIFNVSWGRAWWTPQGLTEMTGFELSDHVYVFTEEVADACALSILQQYVASESHKYESQFAKVHIKADKIVYQPKGGIDKWHGFIAVVRPITVKDIVNPILSEEF